MAKGKIHYVHYINPEYGDGWAECGTLVKEPNSYDEDTLGRNHITCGNCIASLRRSFRRTYYGVPAQLLGG